ncbi:MAG: isoprenyl transferase [Gemmatales bacterium]|nr:isoprenyl transferase [Gemmatales bacterium]MDW8388221.1 isoprenyl transferase [Gemmatales bacterium]
MQTPYSAKELARLGLERATLPRHVAIIMDGNGRWAQRRGLPRVEGHRRGVQSVRAVIEESCRLGLKQLTLYCLSAENWKRPKAELDVLMLLLEQYLIAERREIMEENIRFTTIGRRDPLPKNVLKEIDESVRLSAGNTGLTLCLAVNYGSRSEITDAVRKLAAEVQAGRLDPDDITEETISQWLYTAGMPEPDLLIRTAGEMRVSNFLLWQISYAELYVTPCLWPDFTVEEYRNALRDYAKRERRFGGLNS